MDASIEKNGAVLMGRNFTCDAHFKRPIRVVTHCHSDHLWGFDESLKECEKIIMTAPTRDLIQVIKEREINSPKIECLEYGVSTLWGDEQLTLYPSGHILGSSQVLVENEKQILFTGDFRLTKAPVIKSDILIIEATYGNPWRRRVFKNEVEERLVELITTSLKSGPCYIFGYYGKLQEVLEIIHRADIDVPVILPEKVFKMARIAEMYGMKLGKYFLAREHQGIDKYIGLYHMASKQWIGKGTTKISLSGWEFQEPVRKEREKEFTVAFSDHSDFDELIEYVKLSSPKFVITDNKRVGDAITLAKEIKRRLGIPAKPMP